jgi:hypothetical protein
VVIGAQEGFVESLRTNMTLMRRYVPAADLITECITVGTVVPTSLSLLADPYTSTEVLTTLTQGVHVTVTAYGSDWCAVTYDGLSGYVETGSLTLGNSTTDKAHITFAHPYDATPSVQLTPVGSSPAFDFSCVSGATTLGADVHVSSGVTMAHWLAIGKAGTGDGSEDGETTSMLGAATLGTMILGG